MEFVVTGGLAFIFLYIFDYNKIKFISRMFNLLFGAGVIIIVCSTFSILLSDRSVFNSFNTLKMIYLISFAIAFALLIYSLFFALPFKKTYMSGKTKNSVIDTGFYALCRHPGVIWFFMMYLFLWLFSENIYMLYACVIWTVLDIIHVYIQDKYFFEKSLSGYTAYKRATPFLIPNIKSIRRCFATLK